MKNLKRKLGWVLFGAASRAIYGLGSAHHYDPYPLVIAIVFLTLSWILLRKDDG